MTAALLERDRPTVRTRAATGAAAPKTSAPRRTAKSTRPKLKVLNQQAVRQRARRRHALLTMFIVVLLGFFAVAFVHAELVADQQELDGIRSRIAEAEAHNAKVARAAEEASAPSIIVDRALGELGMVRANQPVYLAAAAPIRDIPVSISFTGRTDTAPIFAAAATAADLTVRGGISGTATVNRVTPAAADQDLAVSDPAGAVIEVQPTPAQDSAAPEVASVSAMTPSVSGAVAGTGTPQAGASTQAVAGAATGAAPQTTAAQTTVAPSTAAATPQVQSSIAGTRAVSAGQSNGAVESGAMTSQLGGTNAGTGSG